MNGILKESGKLFGKTIIINVLCLIVAVSVVSICVAMLADVKGYVAYGQKGEDSAVEELYTYYIEDGEDLKLEEYEKEGYTVSKSEIKSLSKSKSVITLLVAQFFAFGILISFIFPNFWDKGYNDRNMVLTGHMASDPLKGLKIGLISQIPIFLELVIFAIYGNISTLIFKMANASFYGLIELTVGGNKLFSDLEIWKLPIFAAILLILPLITFAGYYLGFKDFSLSEKLTYKNKKSRR